MKNIATATLSRHLSFSAKQLALFAGPLLAVSSDWGMQRSGVDPATAHCAAITVWCATWWVLQAAPMAATSLLPAAAFPLLGVLGERELAASYGGPIVLLMMAGSMMSASMEKSGAHRRLALSMVRVAGGGERGLVLGFLLAAAALSMWINNTATALMLAPVAVAVIDSGGRRRRAALTVPLLLAVTYGSSIGGSAVPIGTPPNLLIISRYREVTGDDISFLQWMGMTLPAVSVMLVVVWLWLARGVGAAATARKAAKHLPDEFSDEFSEDASDEFSEDTSDESSEAITTERLSKGSPDVGRGAQEAASSGHTAEGHTAEGHSAEGHSAEGHTAEGHSADGREAEGLQLAPWRPSERRVLWVFACTAAAWMFRTGPFGGWSSLPIFGAAGGKMIGDSTVALIAAIVLFAMPNGEGAGQRMLDWAHARKKVPWDVLLMMGGGQALGQAFQTTQLSAIMGGVLAPITELPLALTALLICLLCTFLTEITSNTAVTTVVAPILAAAALEAQCDPMQLMLPALLGLNFAFMLPMATGPNAIIYGVGRIPLKTMIREGVVLNFAGAVVIAVVVPWVLAWMS